MAYNYLRINCWVERSLQILGWDQAVWVSLADQDIASTIDI